MPEKILIVEDETALRETLAYTLEREGFAVRAVADGLKALDAAAAQNPDLILLDLMLPGLDGFEVCRRLRDRMNIPILMLTARESEIDRVVGLEMGADDYIIKPFHMRELVARIKAQLRRVRLIREEKVAPPPEEATPEEPILSGDLSINLARSEVLRSGVPLPLKPKEYELLVYFARHRGQALSREQILQRVWGWEYTGDSRTVDVHVRWLREKIEPDPARPLRLVTVRGAGYRFEG
ncbi:MAG: response regulator transcription factor [Anaerolineales bacterium]|nr:response regulator transcription factor [Anaerolineales bacterium]